MSASHQITRMPKEKFQSILDSIQLEIDDRVQKIRHKAKLIKASLELRFDLELSRFPKEVRSMKWVDFCQHYNGDINQFNMKRMAQSPGLSRLRHIRETPVSLYYIHFDLICCLLVAKDPSQIASSGFSIEIDFEIDNNASTTTSIGIGHQTIHGPC